MDNILTPEFISSYNDTLNLYEKYFAEYRALQNDASEFLYDVRERQANDASKIDAMLDDLDREEEQLREKIRKAAELRGKQLLNGEKPVATDIEIGARLAIIPEERAALEMLRDKKVMTGKEKERWYEIKEKIDEVSECLWQVVRNRIEQTSNLMRHVDSVKNWQSTAPRLDFSVYYKEVEKLNQDEADNECEEDEYEEE